MRVWMLATLSSGLLLALPLQTGTGVRGPQGQGRLSIAASTVPEVRQFDGLVDQLVRSGDLVVYDERDDLQLPGRRHAKLAQYYRGIPVYGANLTRQTAGGVTVSLFGTIYQDIELDTAPTLSSEAALTAVQSVSGGELLGNSQPQLTILPTLLGTYLLTYRATMSDIKTYFIDAHRGDVVKTINEIRTQNTVGIGTGVLGDTKKLSTKESGGMFVTLDELRPANVRTLDTRGSNAKLNAILNGLAFESDLASDADNNWTNPGIVDGHVHLGWTHDYFFKQHGLNGIDGENGPIVAAIHTGLINNAFFASPPAGPFGNGMMAYGVTTGGVPITALDVAAHEVMHGVTAFSASLQDAFFFDSPGPTAFTFDGETFSCVTTTFNGFRFLCDAAGRYELVSNHGGAINESFSDVFGACAELFFAEQGVYAFPGDFLLGEDIAGFGPIRAMDVPTSLNAISGLPYPDHLSQIFSFTVIVTAGTPAAPLALEIAPVVIFDGTAFILPSIDDGGEHFNSTVLSHAFFLAVEGGTNPTSGLSVPGVGSANRAQIEQAYMRAMRVHMPQTPTMQLAAHLIFQSAIELFGQNAPATTAIFQSLIATGF